MGHPAIDNKTPFAIEPLFLANETGQPLLVPVIKATYNIVSGNRLALAEEQAVVNTSGEFRGDPDASSYMYEPETACFKPATDVVLIGHAHTPGAGARSVNVGLKAGPVEKVVRVTGNRYWVRRFGMITMSRPEPFERIPLVYERAFGGWDRSHPNPSKHAFHPQNPVGTGFRAKKGRYETGIRLPNLEDPRRPLWRFHGTTPVAGFGFTSPHWQPRAALSGTYDSIWQAERMPLLPSDFNSAFFNAAPPGQVVPGYLRGDEPVIVSHASPNGKISFNLPGTWPPTCRVGLRDRRRHELRTRLDTVIINTDENRLFLLWRGAMPLATGPQDVISIEVLPEETPGITTEPK